MILRRPVRKSTCSGHGHRPPPPAAERTARLRGRRAPPQLLARGRRALGHPGRGQPADPPARGAHRRRPCSIATAGGWTSPTPPARRCPQLNEGFQRLIEASSLLREPPRRRQVTVSVAPSFAAKWLVPQDGQLPRGAPRGGGLDLRRHGAGRPDRGRGRRGRALRPRPLREPARGAADRRGGVAGLQPRGCSTAPAPIRKPEDLAGHVLLHDLSPDVDPSCPDWPMWLKARGVAGVDPRPGPRFSQSALVIEAAVDGPRRGAGQAHPGPGRPGLRPARRALRRRQHHHRLRLPRGDARPTARRRPAPRPSSAG